MNKKEIKPLKTKTTINDLLDMIHLTIIKEKGENDIILNEITAIGEKIKNKQLTNYEINTPFYWTAVFKDIKDNNYIITKKDSNQ